MPHLSMRARTADDELLRPYLLHVMRTETTKQIYTEKLG